MFTIARVHGKMRQAAFRQWFAQSWRGLAAVSGALFGVSGVGIGYLIATVLEGLIFAPTVFGVLKERNRLERKSHRWDRVEGFGHDPLDVQLLRCQSE